MTPGARISAAIDVLDHVFGGMPAEQALTRWARQSRYAGSKDRAAVRDHVFQALRCRRSYAALGGGDDGRAVMIGALRAAGVEPASLFTGEGHAPAALSACEMDHQAAALTEAEAADLPDWLWSVFFEDLSEDAGDLARAQRSRAPIALRVNRKMKTTVQALEILKEEGIFAEQVSGSETALIVTEGERRIKQSAAFTSGLVELQDVSSQSAMARISVSPGARILDYCAGGGGKTLALACGLSENARAQFFAHDSDPARMVDLPERADRAGLIVTRLSTANVPAHAPFDIVLCDVPCSGSGTWRRAPEAKWRLTPDRLKNLTEIQRDIMRSAFKLVAVGGRLVYTTCSLLARENADQVAWFCNEHPDFALTDEHFWPVSEVGDGFYFASLERVA